MSIEGANTIMHSNMDGHTRQRLWRPLSLVLVLLAAVMVFSAVGRHTAEVQATTTWNIGDLFPGVGSGQYQVRAPDGTLKETLTTISGSGFTTGCAFDAAGNLYGTEISNDSVTKFAGPSAPHTTSSFGSGSSTPESIVFDAAGNVYVGNVGNGLRQYAADGTFIQTIINTRVDTFDIAADQDTILYGQEGADVKTVSISTGAPGPNFTTGTATQAFAMRILPDGGLLLADLVNVKRYNSAGVVTQTYDVGGENDWFSLNLDPNGTSFWAGDFGSSNYYKFNISSGAVEAGPLNTGTGTFTLFGLCIFGELTAATGDITLTPPTDENFVGDDHTVTATVTAGTDPLPDVLVSFTVTSGPNAGEASEPGECTANADCTTDAGGQVSWTYSGSGGVGTDDIEACFVDEDGNVKCARAAKDWVPPPNTPPTVSCTESVNPHGARIPPAGSTTLPGPRGGQNEDGFYMLNSADEEDGTAPIFVTNASGSATFGPFASGDVVKITEDDEAVPTSKPMGGPNSAVAAHIILDSDAFIFAVDSFGEFSAVIACLVPGPPK